MPAGTGTRSEDEALEGGHRVVYVFRFESLAGDRFQGEILCKELGAIPLNCTTIMGGQSGVVAVPSKSFGSIYYPVNSIERALEALDPDLVLIHTISTDLVEEIDNLVARYPVALRLGVNLEEFLLNPEVRAATGLILYFISKVDRVIAPSRFVKKNLEALGFMNVVHIPTAIDISNFKTANPDGNRILMCGRLGVVKNFVIPILAMRKILREVPDAELIILGEGGLRDVYENLVLTLGLSEHVKLPGFRRSREFYPSAKVFVAPSISENMSLTVVEALASALPVVASDIGGHRIGKSITYVDHDDIAGFAEAIINLLKNNDEWEERHIQALEDAKMYDVGLVAEDYRELFDDILTLRRQRKERFRAYLSSQEEDVRSRLAELGVKVE